MIHSLPYLREIEGFEWVTEILIERFDNALDLLLPTSVVYGGAVRDALAGMPIKGDLDVASISRAFSNQFENIHSDVRWASKNRKGFSPYEKETRISEIVELVNADGATIQIVSASRIGKDDFLSLASFVEGVDFVCCGVFLTYDGRLFEAVPNAIQDCKEKVLNINKASTWLKSNTIRPRATKLMERGWRCNFDIEKVIKEIRREETKHKKPSAKLTLEELMPIKTSRVSGRISTSTFHTMAIPVDIIELLFEGKEGRPAVKEFMAQTINNFPGNGFDVSVGVLPGGIGAKALLKTSKGEVLPQVREWLAGRMEAATLSKKTFGRITKGKE